MHRPSIPHAWLTFGLFFLAASSTEARPRCGPGDFASTGIATTSDFEVVFDPPTGNVLLLQYTGSELKVWELKGADGTTPTDRSGTAGYTVATDYCAVPGDLKINSAEWLSDGTRLGIIYRGGPSGCALDQTGLRSVWRGAGASTFSEDIAGSPFVNGGWIHAGTTNYVPHADTPRTIHGVVGVMGAPLEAFSRRFTGPEVGVLGKEGTPTGFTNVHDKAKAYGLRTIAMVSHPEGATRCSCLGRADCVPMVAIAKHTSGDHGLWSVAVRPAGSPPVTAQPILDGTTGTPIRLTDPPANMQSWQQLAGLVHPLGTYWFVVDVDDARAGRYEINVYRSTGCRRPGQSPRLRPIATYGGLESAPVHLHTEVGSTEGAVYFQMRDASDPLKASTSAILVDAAGNLFPAPPSAPMQLSEGKPELLYIPGGQGRWMLYESLNGKIEVCQVK